MPEKTRKPWAERLGERKIRPKPQRSRAERLTEFHKRLQAARREQVKFLRTANDGKIRERIKSLNQQLDEAAQQGKITPGHLAELKLEVERFYTLRGGRKWRLPPSRSKAVRSGERKLLKRFEAWRPGDEEGWKEVMKTAARVFDGWLTNLPHSPRELALRRHFITWQFGKRLTFKKYGLDGAYNAIYLGWLLGGAKPKGFGTVIKNKGNAEPWLLADKSLQSVHKALSEKEIWEIARETQSFDGYVWRSYANAIKTALFPPPKSPIEFVEDPEAFRVKEISKGLFERQPLRFVSEEQQANPRRRIRVIADDKYFADPPEDVLTNPETIDIVKLGLKYVKPKHRDVLALYGWISKTDPCPWPEAKRKIAKQLEIDVKTVQRRYDEIVLTLRKVFRKES